MTPFETLIHELGEHMGMPLQPDHHQSCRLEFGDGFSVQIDLEGDADSVLVGSEIGGITPGVFREKIFKQALRINGMSRIPYGTLAFSEMNDTLILFQFLPVATLNGEKLWNFLQPFLEHGKIWKEALERGDVPSIEGDTQRGGSGFYGMKP